MPENQINQTAILGRIRSAVDTRGKAATQLLAQRILERAIQNVGTKYSGHHPEDGRLLKDAGSITPFGTGHAVVFTHPVAKLHHDGARAHKIPFADGKTSGGKPAFFRSQPQRFGPVRRTINHPGARPNPYLRNAVTQVGGTIASGSLMRGTAGPFPIVRASNSFA